MPHRRYFAFLSILFAGVFLALAIKPYDRADWALENVLVVVFVILMVATSKKFTFSRISYTFMFLFMCLHQLGAHYTYSKVPYDSFLLEYAGFTLQETFNLTRNHYDRLVHFLFGLLIAYPVREVYCRVAYGRGFWGYFFPFLFTMAASMTFEFFEWAAASVFGGDLGMAYLGAQGDEWDSHKDSLLASVGALLAMLITMGINMRIQEDFFEEWKNSLRIKRKQPLGEDEIKRLLEKKDRDRSP